MIVLFFMEHLQCIVTWFCINLFVLLILLCNGLHVTCNKERYTTLLHDTIVHGDRFSKQINNFQLLCFLYTVLDLYVIPVVFQLNEPTTTFCKQLNQQQEEGKLLSPLKYASYWIRMVFPMIAHCLPHRYIAIHDIAYKSHKVSFILTSATRV
jgi:hypothetical protein